MDLSFKFKASRRLTTAAAVAFAIVNAPVIGGHVLTVMGSSIMGGSTAADYFTSGLAYAEAPSRAAVNSAEAKQLSTHSKDMPGIALQSGAEGSTLTIKANGLADKKYSVEKLSNPERLVIDITGQAVSQNKNFDTTDSSVVSKVRVGAHPGKSRIVLDLKGDKAVRFDSKLDGEKLVVTLTGSSSKIAKNEAGAIALPVIDALAKNTEPKFDQANELLLAKAEDKDAQGGVLRGLSIEQSAPGQNVLIADIEGSFAAPSIKRTAPTEFVVTVPDAKIDPLAAGALVAPPLSGSIRSARPVTQNGDLMLRVFTTPGTELASKVEEGKLVVAVATKEQKAIDVLAQAKPPAEEPAKSEPKAEPIKTPEAAKENAKKNEAKSTEATVTESSTSSASDEFGALLGDESKFTGRLISLDLQDTDIDNALRIIAEVSNLNIIASEDVTGKITLRLIDVPWDQALDVILKTNGLDKVQEGNVVRIAPVEKLRQERESLKNALVAEQELEPLSVEYVRVSYAKASELKSLVESVLTERGSVTYDERTNQLIIKDIKLGLKNSAKLIGKIDLRTPQILIETQIVEGKRSLLRDLGSELGFKYVMSPATGNATGSNFPNAITIGGGAASQTNGNMVAFPAGVSPTAGSAVSYLLGSADGTKTLTGALTALENEGTVRTISRPSVATTNSKQAVIKSVEKIRIKVPSGGLSFASGPGASASGSGATATEVVEIGIVLEITPQASPDYYVLLDINAKSSSLGNTQVDGIPSEVEHSATSSVLVSSGQTFAMGGIYKMTDNNSLSGVPFLKDIPAIGTFFRRQKVDNSDEELLFFLTPRIVEGSFDDATMRANAK